MRSRFKVYPDTGMYYITSTIIDWTPIIINDDICTILINSFKHCQEHKNLWIFGYVIMPNHFHMIISMENSLDIPNVIRDMKRYTSRKISNYIKQNTRQNFKPWLKQFCATNGNTVWQKGYHPILIESDKWFNQKLDYIHYNPVEKGFVDLPEYWRYSSARNYILDDHSILSLDLDKL